MNEKNLDTPQEKQLTPEEQLDLLLEKFKEEPVLENQAEDTAEICAETTLPEEKDAAEATGETVGISQADPVPETESEEVPEEIPMLDNLIIEENAEDTLPENIPAEMPEMLPIPDAETSELYEPEVTQESTETEPSFTEPETASAEMQETESTEPEPIFVGEVPEAVETPEQPGGDLDPAENTEDAEDTQCEPVGVSDEPQSEPVEAIDAEKNQPAATEPVATAEEKAEADDEEEYIEENDEEDIEPPKKRRPRNNKAYGFFGIPHVLATLVWLGIIVFIGVGLGRFVWNCASDILALGRTDSVVTITVTEDDDLDSLAQKLKNTGLIKYPSLFKLYGQISDAMDSIRTGTFQLNTLFDYHALVDAMSSNQRRVTINVTIPEGYTMAQTFDLLEHYGVSTADSLEEAAANGELGEYWFLEGVDRSVDNCLEGYLFPDTYTFYLDHDPVGVLQKFLNNFNKRFNDVMKLKLDTLNVTLAEMMRKNGLSEEYIAQHQITLRDVVIIASMIEKETASNPESYTISSVIYNRLTNPNEYPYLNIDATLVYYKGGGKLTAEDLATDHPYNTYTRPGLVPGPISNPGGYSLDAALDPAQTAYYFYALDPSTGEHHFSKTLKEHNDFLESIRNAIPEEEPEE